MTLGWGGHFSLPTDLRTARTDAAGNYTIEHALSYSEPCPFVWVMASAPGYNTTSREHSGHQVACTGSPQHIAIKLTRN